MGLVALAAVTAIYFFSGAFSFNEGGHKHFTAHAGACFSTNSIPVYSGFRISVAMFNLVYSQRGAVFGAAYVMSMPNCQVFYL